MHGTTTSPNAKDRVVLTLNGLVTVDCTGNIAVQIHSGPPSEVWYKDIELTED